MLFDDILRQGVVHDIFGHTYVAHAGLDFTVILMPQPPKWGNFRHVPPCPAVRLLLNSNWVPQKKKKK